MTNDFVFVAGRALLALAFIGRGSLHLFDGWRGRGLWAAVAFAAIELAAGLALLLGWQARWIALALSIFLLVDAGKLLEQAALALRRVRHRAR